MNHCRFACLCCGSLTFERDPSSEAPDGCDVEMCAVCLWEPGDSLAVARTSFAVFGVCDPHLIGESRPALPEERSPALVGGRPHHGLRTLLCEVSLGTLDPLVLPEVAEGALRAGVASPLLERLAAGAAGAADAAELAVGALRELEVPTPAVEEAALWLAQSVAADMLDGTVRLQDGAAQITAIAGALRGPGRLRRLQPFVAAHAAWTTAEGEASRHAVEQAARHLVLGALTPITVHELPSACTTLDEMVYDVRVPVVYLPEFREYGVTLTGSSATQQISHCPWCGVSLPSSLRAEWFDGLRALDVDPDGWAIPPAFRTDRWWREQAGSRGPEVALS